jgi:hypothetical protein
MKDRCKNPKNVSYSKYGGSGVKIDPTWEIFTNFLADMGERPEGTTLGRLNDIGNYTAANCEWQTYKEQAKKGEQNGRALLTNEQVACIRSLYKSKARRGCSAKNIAADLNINVSVVNDITSYRSWGYT